MAITSRTDGSLTQGNTGLKLAGFGVVLFFVTRIIVWLPLGFLGSWINAVLWPVLVLSVLAGAGMMYLRYKRSSS